MWMGIPFQELKLIPFLKMEYYSYLELLFPQGEGA
jgi:hypothetical protein